MSDKIKIVGSARKFDQAELERRQAGYHNVYKSTDQCTTVVHGDIAFGFLTKVIEMTTQGYVLTHKYPIVCSPTVYYCSMTKPESEQAVDLQVINDRVKREYVKELEEELAEYKQMLTAQLLQAAQLKEAEKVEKAKAKLLADIQKEVDATFSDLVIPD
ncbi:hypothetical protein J2X66_005628 [Pseudomonas sp. 3296]|uniref:hypothetical protein n=1 Tax=Pseudomonas sp. 3296 TaxID=2817753 RepID=UPI00285A5EDE|nr:hypothetical protein [Pseudomonas sp. 3296]MDR6918725.1 hypothetical protein [Pseudomonas sp. 3296]